MGLIRIDDPWGPRTPYGRGEPWPVPVDEHHADGTIKTLSAYALVSVDS